MHEKKGTGNIRPQFGDYFIEVGKTKPRYFQRSDPHPQTRKIEHFRKKSIPYQKISEIFAQNLVF